MADTGVTVWAAGLWADDFWAAGLWAGGEAPPVEAEPQIGGIGRRKRKPHRRYFVEVDGQSFLVDSPEHAQQILRQAADLAQQAAERAIEPVIAKPVSAKVEPVRLKAPEIRTNAPIDLKPYRDAIKQAYRNAAVAAELRRLLEAKALQEREDEETAAILLLH